jgi:hypothetical protein
MAALAVFPLILKTNVYIDSFNLYYGSLKGSPHKWLNVLELCQRHFPQNLINRVRFFTARVQPRPNDPQQPARQAIYLRALETLPSLTIHYGHFLVSQIEMPLVYPLPATSNVQLKRVPPAGSIRVLVRKTEEKGSDVNIATYLMLDAHNEDFDAAIIVSNDSDLYEPIRLVRTVFQKRIVVLHPCTNPNYKPSLEPKKAASKSVLIDPAHLPKCQFPSSLSDSKGRIITKPSNW